MQHALAFGGERASSNPSAGAGPLLVRRRFRDGRDRFIGRLVPADGFDPVVVRDVLPDLRNHWASQSVAGLIADRFDRQRVMVISDIAGALVW
jgi:hypothetical protein